MTPDPDDHMAHLDGLIEREINIILANYDKTLAGETTPDKVHMYRVSFVTSLSALFFRGYAAAIEDMNSREGV